MRRILLIATIILLSTIATLAQTGRLPGSSADVRMVKVYPNPATSFINFEFQQGQRLSDYSFSVYNFIGKKVVEINNLTPRTTIDLNEYFRGVYIFQLKDRRSGQILESGKFQVVK